MLDLSLMKGYNIPCVLPTDNVKGSPIKDVDIQDAMWYNFKLSAVKMRV